MNALYIGLMSGTSMDGIDAVLCRFESGHFAGVVAHHASAYEPALRQQLLDLQKHAHSIALRQYADLDARIADAFADTANDLLKHSSRAPAQIAAIGSHGQTIFHDPHGARSSLQLGDPNRIAARTGVATVADFRRKDIALGGQGAPLVPAFHQALFADANEARAVLNLGGIANLTLLPADGAPVRGFDTGPGNGLMDEWAQRHLNQPFDSDGAFAASGSPHAALLESLLSDPYFHLAPPKSTGRGQFHLDWISARYPAYASLPPADVQCTLAELTARSICDTLRLHAPNTQRLLVCGGGVRNGFLMQRLRAFVGIPVEATDTHGLDAQSVEAAAFAWLAMRSVNRWSGNLPAVTGASREAILGGIFYP